MEKRVFLVQFIVHGLSRKLEYIIRCSQSISAITEGLKHLAKTVPQPAVVKVIIKELDNLESVFPF